MNINNNSKNKMVIFSQFWFVFYIIFFLNIFVFTIISFFLITLWNEINQFLINIINIEFNWLAIILVLTCIVLVYASYLIIFYGIKIARKSLTTPHLANKIIPFPLLIIWNIMLYLLISETGSELIIVRSLLENMSPILWLILILILSASLMFIIPKFIEAWNKSKANKNRKIQIILTFSLIFIIFLALFSVPFFVLPANVLSNGLPTKPNIIAHRGASSLAPENTIAAGEQAVVWGASGWEVDVTISYDGVLFLMHDNDLIRTTDVEEVFPNRINEPASNFTIAEIKQLDAGSWFVENDPFKTIKKNIVSDTLANSYRGEEIPILDEVINFTQDNNLILDIDSRRPYTTHPFHDSYYDILLTKLNASGLGKNILVSSSSPLAENMTHVCGPITIEEFQANNCELINTHHGLSNEQFKEYNTAGIQVMVWTVDSKIRFSQLWCLGVDYVKTNVVHLMVDLENPNWYIHRTNYFVILGVIEFCSPLLFVLLINFRKRKRL